MPSFRMTVFSLPKASQFRVLGVVWLLLGQVPEKQRALWSNRKYKTVGVSTDNVLITKYVFVSCPVDTNKQNVSIDTNKQNVTANDAKALLHSHILIIKLIFLKQETKISHYLWKPVSI